MRDVPLKGDAPQPGRYVKISVFLKKRPDITDDYFRTYWYHNHAILFVKSAAFQKYVVKYNQVEPLDPIHDDCHKADKRH
jgi:hypothetical protein